MSILACPDCHMGEFVSTKPIISILFILFLDIKMEKALTHSEVSTSTCTPNTTSWVPWAKYFLQGAPTGPSWRRSVLGVHWKDWCWSWNSNTLATWCEELIHWKRPWCWERLGAGGEGDDRGRDGWMASPTHEFGWIPGVCVGQGGLACCMQLMGLQRVGHNWETELNWIIIFR